MIKTKLYFIAAALGIFTSIGHSQNLQETWEDDSPTKDHWTYSTEGWDIVESSYAAYEGTHYMYNGEFTSDTLISPKLSIETGDEIRFWARYYAQQGAPLHILKVLFSTDLVTWQPVKDLTGQLSYLNFNNYYASLDDFVGQGYLAFVGRSRVYLDSISGPEVIIPDNDLSVKVFNAPEELRVGEESVLSVKVKNEVDSIAESFEVKIMRDSIVLASTTYSNLAGNDTAWVNVSFTPAEDGTFEVYALVDYAIDENLGNNISLPKNIRIMAENDFYTYIRRPDTGGERTHPVMLAQKTAISEQMYPGEYIPVGGYIKKVGLPVKVASQDIDSIPIKIWMGETNQYDLTEGWIPTSKLQLVYDGTVSFTEGTNYIIFLEFEEENYFHYSKAGELVFFVEKEFIETTYSNVYFNADFWDDSRTCVRYFYSNEESFNTELLTDEGFDAIQYSDIALIINTENTGTVSGYIKDVSSNPLSNAMAYIEEQNIYATSDENGYFNIPSLPVGNYTMTVSDSAYDNLTVQFEVLEGEETSLNITLENSPLVNITGALHDLISGQGVHNAIATITGAYTYTDTTSDVGDFKFYNIFGNQDYTLTFTKYGYVTNVSQITVSDTELDLGTIEIEPLLFPVQNLTATILNNDSLSLTWEEPAENIEDIESYSIYVLENGIVDSTQWLLISHDIINTNYIDTEWSNLDQNSYQYAVLVKYVDGFSQPVFTETLIKNRFSEPSFQLIGSDESFPENAEITLTHVEFTDSMYVEYTDGTGYAIFNSVWYGLYDLTISCPGYYPEEQDSIVINTDNPEFNYELEVINYPVPSNLTYQIDLDDVYLTWNWPETGSPLSYTVIRNDEIFAENITDTSFTDMDLSYGDYSYAVYAVYEGGISDTSNRVELTILELMPPTNLQVSSNRLNVTLSWIEPNVNYAFYDGYEEHEDFAIEFEPWTLIDEDGAYTFYNGYDFQNNIDPKSFFIYNQNAIDPENDYYQAYSGDKCAISFNAYQKNTEDWMIAPPVYIEEGYNVSFMARSHATGQELAHFGVMVGDEPNPESMELITLDYNEAPAEDWTEFSFDLSEFAGQIIYVGIYRFEAYPTAFLMIDEFLISNSTKNTRNGILGYNIYRDGMLVNDAPVPFSFFKEEVDASGEYEYKVTAVYASGESVEIGPISINTYIPEISVSPENISIELPEDETETILVTVTNSGTADLEYNLSVEYDVENSDKPKAELNIHAEGILEFRNSSIIPPTNTTDKEVEVLWDNSNIIPSTSGILSMQFGGLPDGQNLTNGADDFYIQPGVTWELSRIQAQGFTSEFMLIPSMLGIIIYNDNDGKPGDDIHVEYFNSVADFDQVLVLEDPLLLNGGRYWLSVFGYYPDQIDASIGRWNWTTGTLGIGNTAMLQDKALLFNYGQGFNFTPITELDLNIQSYYFIIEGEKSGEPYEWLTTSEISDIVIPGESSEFNVVLNPEGLESGTYNANIKVSNNANAYPDVSISCTLEVPIVESVEPLNKSEYKLYPNPASNYLNIVAEDIEYVEVFNIAGEMIMKNTLRGNKSLDVRQLKQGMYFIRLFDAENKVSVMKFSKE